MPSALSSGILSIKYYTGRYSWCCNRNSNIGRQESLRSYLTKFVTYRYGEELGEEERILNTIYPVVPTSYIISSV